MQFMLIFNHESEEKSVRDIQNESNARDAIESQKRGRNITYKTYDAPDRDAAIQETERIEPGYHLVENALQPARLD